MSENEVTTIGSGESERKCESSFSRYELLLEEQIGKAKDPSILSELLRERRDSAAEWAEVAFRDALSAFKSNRVEPRKDQTRKVEGWGGETVNYNYSSLGALVEAYAEPLANVDLGFRWEPEIKDSVLTIVCILEHRLGYRLCAELSAPIDMSGGKNALEGLGSTQTYLERRTLQAVLGEALPADDDDGQRHISAADPGSDNNQAAGDYISEEQAAALRDKVEEYGVEESTLLVVLGSRYMVKGLNAIEDIPAGNYGDALRIVDEQAVEI